MLNVVDVTGDGKGTVFLIKGNTNVLYEAGMAYCAAEMVENIRRELGDQELHAVLISHSHYDHVAGLPYVRREWPEAVVYGSVRAREILKKPSALATIRELSRAAADAAGSSWDGIYEDAALQIDVGLLDGQIVTVGDCEVTAVETIGHTRCALTYLVNREVLFCSETIGVMTGERRYIPAFLVDFKAMMEAIGRCRKLPASRIVISHFGFVDDGEIPRIWDFLEEKAVESKDVMLSILEKYDSEERQLKEMYRVFHTGISGKDQPDEAFYINAASMLKTLRRQFLEVAS